jgi:hypothetical protein
MLYAQSWENMFRQYIEGTLDSLPNANLSVADENNPFYITLKGIFEPNGEEAFKMYNRALQQASDSALLLFLKDKIYDYYYARGLYITAEKYKNTLKIMQTENRKSTATSGSTSDEKGIFLQFGVFSSEKNARKFMDKNRKYRIPFKILKKGNMFYVVSGPYFDELEARSEKDKIREHSHLKPFVKQF